jgi:hypothetical protein
MNLLVTACTTHTATIPPAPLHRLDAISRVVADFNRAVGEYSARFEGLTGDYLRDLEIAGNRDCDDVTDHMEQLLPVLADWRQRLDAFEDALTPADLALIIRSGANAPVAVAYRQAAASFDLYTRCRDAAHSAWVDWSFNPITFPAGDPRSGDYGAGRQVDAPELVPVPCTLDGCDGYGHPEDCTRRLDGITLGCGLEITTELVSSSVEGLYVSVFGMYDPYGPSKLDEALNVHARSGADLEALAADLERAAAMIRAAASALPPVEAEAGVCATCERSWPAADLSEDRDGDTVCCDCASSDPSAEDAAACRAYRMGR